LKQKILGIHHITAIADDAQRNLDFYSGVLGLRLVKLTVNFDDPGTYHLYYGNGSGAPGTILTFFAYPGAVHGRQGAGQAQATAFAVPEATLSYWSKRLKEHNVPIDEPSARFGEQVLAFADPDGLPLELVAAAGEAAEPWANGSVAQEFAIRGFYGISLSEHRGQPTAALLTDTLGLSLVGQEGNRSRYQAGQDAPGAHVDILQVTDQLRGTAAVGAVHHVAWRTPDDAGQAVWRETLVSQGLDVTPVMDRIYFHSIYFREPGGILFEIATDTPGFAVDELPAELGTALRLPPWLEPQRPQIERTVQPVRLPQLAGRVIP
jgi:glyoxalase family protein